jgi:hypothetical protein
MPLSIMTAAFLAQQNVFLMAKRRDHLIVPRKCSMLNKAKAIAFSTIAICRFGRAAIAFQFVVRDPVGRYHFLCSLQNPSLVKNGVVCAAQYKYLI